MGCAYVQKGRKKKTSVALINQKLLETLDPTKRPIIKERNQPQIEYFEQNVVNIVDFMIMYFGLFFF